MADYTSTQNGNWSADATWGGGGHPSANNDTATIAHEVTYDMGDSAVSWGNVTINSGGILIFPIDADSTILFNTTAVLTVNSGGELRAGTSGAPIDKDYHCYFRWPQGAAYRNVFVLNDGGTINIYGDPDYYGSERYADLDSDWSSGQTLYITGDFSSKWQSGQKFYIHRNILYNDYLTDAFSYTIDTIGAYDSVNNRTPITIVEAAPGIIFYAINSESISELMMISRNVILCDPGASTNVGSFFTYSTERIRFRSNQGSGNSLLHIDNALFYGWDYALNSGENNSINQCIYISNSYCLHTINDMTIDCDMISNAFGGYNLKRCIISGRICSNIDGLYNTDSSKFTGDFINNIRTLGTTSNYNEVIGNIKSNRDSITSNNNNITGDFILNTYGIMDTHSINIKGDFIGNTCGIYYSDNINVIGDFSSNTDDVILSIIFLSGTFGGGINITYLSNEKKSIVVFEECAISNIQKVLRIYENCGTILPLTSADGDFQTPDSNNSWIFQMIPNSYCTDIENLTMKLSPLRDMAFYCDVGTYTLTIKIYPSGWTTPVDQDDIYIIASYFSGTGSDRATAQTSSETFANDGWRSCTVTFTTGRAGIVYFNLYCTVYESACYVLLDPQWIITSSSATLDVLAIHGVPFKFTNFVTGSAISLESKIYDTLMASVSVTALVSGRIYPQTRPQNESKPALIYFRAGGERQYSISDGYSNLENPRISIEAYATTIDARRELGDEIITAMEASTLFKAIADMAPVDFFDPVIGEYKRIIDFTIWNHDT